MWWTQSRAALEKQGNLRVMRITAAECEALAALAERSMSLHCTVQDGEYLIAGRETTVRVVPQCFFGAAG